jgi:hypothetical protein
VTRPSRISRAAIVAQLRAAATKGDRSALALAIDQMKTWAYSPRYWQKYLQLLTHPMARLVDLTVIKQGDKIAHQKGWVKPKREPRKPRLPCRAGAPGRRPRQRSPPFFPRADRPTVPPVAPPGVPPLDHWMTTPVGYMLLSTWGARGRSG